MSCDVGMRLCVLVCVVCVRVMGTYATCPAVPPCTCVWHTYHNTLQCSGLGITSQNVLKLPPSGAHVSIHEANFSHNALREVYGRRLSSQLPGLAVLDLTANRFQNVQDTGANDIPSLTELHLTFNDVMALVGSPFSRLENLIFLNISENKLLYLDNSSFTGLSSLLYLDLSYNTLTQLDAGTFSPCAGSLQHLDLSHNFLGVIEAGVFTADMTNLTTLRIATNFLKTLQPDSFILPALYELDLSANRILKLEPSLFNHVGASLSVLNLKRNSISKLHQDTFSNLTALTILNLEQNKLKMLPTGLLNDSSRLKNLHLGSNDLDDDAFPRDFFAQFPDLEQLDLGVNPLTSMPDVSRASALYFLNMMNTGVTTLYPCTFPEQHHVSNTSQSFALMLYKTPLRCDCQLSWINQWIQEGLLTEATILHSFPSFYWVCASPARLRGRAFHKVSIDELVCEEEANDGLPRPLFCSPDITDKSHLFKVLEYKATSITLKWTLRDASMVTNVEVSWQCSSDPCDDAGGKVTATMRRRSDDTFRYTVQPLLPEREYTVCLYAYGVVKGFTHLYARACQRNLRTRSPSLDDGTDDMGVISALHGTDHTEDNSSLLPIIIGSAVVLTALLCVLIGLVIYAVSLSKRCDTNPSNSVSGFQNPVYELQDTVPHPISDITSNPLPKDTDTTPCTSQAEVCPPHSRHDDDVDQKMDFGYRQLTELESTA